MSQDIRPFRLDIPQAELDDLRARLANTRWPEAATGEPWQQGAPLADVQALCSYWADGYDWRRCEAMLNGFGQYVTEIDGLDIHFLHVRSPHDEALPLLMTHGWPGSVIEFHKIIGPLTDPTAHGGRAEDAFHVVVPSLPGYGFSGKPTEAGWSVERIARAWFALMQRLQYDRFMAQGGDWGAMVTLAMAAEPTPALAMAHVNLLFAAPNEGERASLSPREQAALESIQRYYSDGNGYAIQQSTRPQTLGYALTDSPAGQAAWIFEKFREWSDCDGDPLSVFDRDELLDNIMLYWLPAAAASSARLYWESFRNISPRAASVPLACSIFPGETSRPSRAWAERLYPTLAYWGEPECGGHFAAFEQPELFVNELRKASAIARQ